MDSPSQHLLRFRRIAAVLLVVLAAGALASITLAKSTGSAASLVYGPDEFCNGIDDNGVGGIDEGFPDTDQDGHADCVDLDDDNDSIPGQRDNSDGRDNCPQVSNPQQTDSTNPPNGIGDACDPNTAPMNNPPNAVPITTDGEFGFNEWSSVTPASFLSGASKVYSVVEDQDIYLMYDYSLNSAPLSPGQEVGPISFQVGGGSFFDVFVVEGSPDTVRVTLNGGPFNNVDCIAGAVDNNTTSPNFASAHNLVELEVHLTGTGGDCYSPEPEFWSATLPRVTVSPQATAASTATTNVQVSAAFFDIDETGNTAVTPLAFPGNPTSVTLASFTGRPVGKNAVRLTWRTTSELGTLGFNVWRFANGKGVKVNRALVAAKAAGRIGGATYRLLDKPVRPGLAHTYRLQVVNQNGTRAWRASTTVRARR